MTQLKYEEIGLKKRAERDSKIPKEWRITIPEDDDNLLHLPRTCGILNETEIDITESYDSVGLLAKIHAGVYSSLQVTTAFCKVRIKDLPELPLVDSRDREQQ